SSATMQQQHPQQQAQQQSMPIMQSYPSNQWMTMPATINSNSNNNGWASNAMTIPLEFNFNTSQAAMPIDNDWGSWLDGMSSFPAEALPPMTQLPLFGQRQDIMQESSPSMSATDSGCILIPSPSYTESDRDYKTTNNGFRKRRRRFGSNNNKNKQNNASEDDEDDDESLVKRMRNTEAARKSRARKAAKVDSLESKVAALESETTSLSVRIAVLESDASSFAQREADLKKRVAMLEDQLAESYRALLARS
ncbi:UNVERIFIED_CONTAM: hypothetical protein HDU68_005094, partial [Siphonaria sp. JEL0065]